MTLYGMRRRKARETDEPNVRFGICQGALCKKYKSRMNRDRPIFRIELPDALSRWRCRQCFFQEQRFYP
jgi:hypothetical protein